MNPDSSYICFILDLNNPTPKASQPVLGQAASTEGAVTTTLVAAPHFPRSTSTLSCMLLLLLAPNSVQVP